jgi:CubicO group peptidase (beta-lactamase class C family)
MKLIFSLAITLLSINHAFASQLSTNVANINQLVQQANQTVGFTGTVLVAKSGAIIYHQSVGFIDSDKTTPLTTKHRLSPGSIGKEFTTVAIMMLAQKDKLNYSDKLSAHLPKLPAWASSITIEQIMTHTSGLPRIQWNMQGITTTADVMKQIAAINTLEFAAGTGYLYGNMNVVLRALIVEQITKQPFEQFLQQQFYDPAGMVYAIIPSQTADYPNLIVKGGLSSVMTGIVEDMTAFDLYQFEQNLWRGKWVDKKELTRVMLKPHLLSGNPKRSYFDFGRRTVNNNKLIDATHNGSNPSHHAYKFSHFGDELTIVLMSIDGNQSTLAEMLLQIIHINRHGVMQIPGSWWLQNAMNSKGSKGSEGIGGIEGIEEISAAVQSYQQQVKQGTIAAANEQTLKLLGYQMSGKGRLDEALILFKLNLQSYPDSADAYDSYAEHLIKAGQFAQAKTVVLSGIVIAEQDGDDYVLGYLKKHLQRIQAAKH